MEDAAGRAAFPLLNIPPCENRAGWGSLSLLSADGHRHVRSEQTNLVQQIVSGRELKDLRVAAAGP